jgi:hypothetical protein
VVPRVRARLTASGISSVAPFDDPGHSTVASGGPPRDVPYASPSPRRQPCSGRASGSPTQSTRKAPVRRWAGIHESRPPMSRSGRFQRPSIAAPSTGRVATTSAAAAIADAG